MCFMFVVMIWLGHFAVKNDLWTGTLEDVFEDFEGFWRHIMERPRVPVCITIICYSAAYQFGKT